MDIDVIISEIIRRVTQVEEIVKPQLLVLSPQHGEICHCMLESEKVKQYYNLDCALLANYEVNLQNYEAVIMYGLTNENLCKLSGGVCDDDFTKLAQKAFLLGKKVFILTSEVELLKFCNKTNYYKMLEEKLNFLVGCGLCICENSSIEDIILSGAEQKLVESEACEAVAEKNVEKVCCEEKTCCEENICCDEKVITKKVITEKDMAQAYSDGVRAISIAKKAILTDLAKEFAHERKMTITRA